MTKLSKYLLGITIISGLVLVGCDSPENNNGEENVEVETTDETSEDLVFEFRVNKDGVLTTSTFGYQVNLPEDFEVYSAGDYGFDSYVGMGRDSFSLSYYENFGETLESEIEFWKDFFSDPEFYPDLNFVKDFEAFEVNDEIEALYSVVNYTSYEDDVYEYYLVFIVDDMTYSFEGANWSGDFSEEEFLEAVKTFKFN